MQYLILAYEDPTAFEAREDPARRGDYVGAWASYIQAVKASGVVVHSMGQPSPRTAGMTSSTTVRR